MCKLTRYKGVKGGIFPLFKSQGMDRLHRTCLIEDECVENDL